MTPALTQMPSASQGDIIDIDDNENVDNQDDADDVTEHFCNLRVEIVGIQYYKGGSPTLWSLHD
jgi:hypothetical protein